MDASTLLILIILTPIIFGVISYWAPHTLHWMTVGVSLTSILSGVLIYQVVNSKVPVFALSKWLFIDPLSTYHLFVMIVVVFICSLYTHVYFKNTPVDPHPLSLFSLLWSLSIASVLLVIFSNHVAFMWVGVESTTIFTTLLIALHQTKMSIEAMWKYLIICSIGVAFALIGTILLAASTTHITSPTDNLLFWTTLRDNASQLDIELLKISFIFILVGYGTKTGLAPMHTWLPDAYSQAPSPVSALFSGFIINIGLYCISRFIPIIETATNNSGFALILLQGIGLFSIVIASAFILFQKDIKRLLAYCSIEHMGIIILGLGLGGIGTFVALFHTLNHSISKILSFFAAGRLGQIYKTHQMDDISNTIKVFPIGSIGLLVGLLTLIGMAPFSIFMSELQLIKFAINKNAWLQTIIFLLGTSIIFISILKHTISMVWGKNENHIRIKATTIEYIIILIPIFILVGLGVYMPETLRIFIANAADIINGVK